MIVNTFVWWMLPQRQTTDVTTPQTSTCVLKAASVWRCFWASRLLFIPAMKECFRQGRVVNRGLANERSVNSMSFLLWGRISHNSGVKLAALASASTEQPCWCRSVPPCFTVFAWTRQCDSGAQQPNSTSSRRPTRADRVWTARCVCRVTVVTLVQHGGAHVQRFDLWMGARLSLPTRQAPISQREDGRSQQSGVNTTLIMVAAG